MIEWLAQICFIGSGFFILVAGIGIFRFENLAARIHATTKGGGMALVLNVLAFLLLNPSWANLVKGMLTVVFAFLTLPLAAQVLAGKSVSRDDDSPQRL